MQPVDSNTVSRIQNTVPNGRALMSCSNIVSIAWGEHKFKKTCTVSILKVLCVVIPCMNE